MSFCCSVIKKISQLLACIAVLILCFGAYLGYNYFSDNVHTVIPGQIYRSAQFDHAALTKYTKKLQLKTIINLRGRWPSNPWYQVESAFAHKHHLNYYSVQFSSYEVPSKSQLQELVALLQTAPKPLIFHCEGGADRTGMAAAISVILFDKHPTKKQIERQASWHYNAISPRTVGYQVMRNYFAWLKQNHFHSSKERFLQWVGLSAPLKTYHGWFVV